MTWRGGCATGLHRGSKAWRISWRLRGEERTLDCRCELVGGGAEQGISGRNIPDWTPAPGMEGAGLGVRGSH